MWYQALRRLLRPDAAGAAASAMAVVVERVRRLWGSTGIVLVFRGVGG